MTIVLFINSLPLFGLTEKNVVNKWGWNVEVYKKSNFSFYYTTL